MRYKNEAYLNQGNYYKENQFNSSDCFEKNQLIFQSVCYDETDHEKSIESSSSSSINLNASLITNVHPTSSPLSQSSNDYTCSSPYDLTHSTNDYLCTSTDHLRSSINSLNGSHLKLPINNSLINSTTMVTSSSYFMAHNRNRIPLPGELEMINSFDTDSLIRLRNLRERKRVRNVNDGFDRLRKCMTHLPNQQEFKKDKRLSKVQTLKLAITYIRQLENILNNDSTGGHK